jgi:hypothetical protein
VEVAVKLRKICMKQSPFTWKVSGKKVNLSQSLTPIQLTSNCPPENKTASVAGGGLVF